jgi:phosphomannomutase
MKSYIFDVDGTLTPSRMMMNEAFRQWFYDWQQNHSTYLITGSTRDMTFGQIGEAVYDSFKRVYQCQGNDVWEQGKLIATKQVVIPESLHVLFEEFLKDSKFDIRTGRHIDQRPGLINFSIVGRNATREQRKEYIEWDLGCKERVLLAQLIRESHHDWEVSVAGETGIDLVKHGFTKAQIVKDFDDLSDLVYFGDRCEEGGNDHDIAQKIKDAGGTVYPVDDWEHTWQILKTIRN